MSERPVPPIVERQSDDGGLEVFDTVEAAAGSCSGEGWLVREGIAEFYDSRGYRLTARSSDDDRDVEISFDTDAVAEPELLAERLRGDLRQSRFCELADLDAASLGELLAEQRKAQQRYERTLLSYRIKRLFGRVRD